jgi:circadian clock protein KaiB
MGQSVRTGATVRPPPGEHVEAGGRYVLHLYVTGMTPHSTRAVANLKAICEEHPAGRYHLEVIDLYRQPALARGDRIPPAPTLIKKRPHLPRRLVGGLSRTDRVPAGLDFRPAR